MEFQCIFNLHSSDEYQDQKQHGVEGFIWLAKPTHIALRKTRIEIQEQELRQRPWRNADTCFSLPGLPLLLSHRHQDPLTRVTPPAVAWAPLEQSFTKKIPQDLPIGQSYEGIFSFKSSSPPNMSRFVSNWQRQVAQLVRLNLLYARGERWGYNAILLKADSQHCLFKGIFVCFLQYVL